MTNRGRPHQRERAKDKSGHDPSRHRAIIRESKKSGGGEISHHWFGKRKNSKTPIILLSLW